jgi:hypothetical protein
MTATDTKARSGFRVIGPNTADGRLHCWYAATREHADLLAQTIEDCYLHGYPDPRRCPFCGLFRGHNPCKRCGCKFGIPKQVQEQTP